MTSQEIKIILASKSPRRYEIMRDCNVNFEVITTDVEELKFAESPGALVQLNAKKKALDVARTHPESLVIGADTVVAFNGKIIGKPKNLTDAKSILKSLSGQTHSVFTGVVLIKTDSGIDISYAEESQVCFKPFTDVAIVEYLTLVPVLDKAGAYAIQEHGDMLLDHYSGELNNIIGLPTNRLLHELEQIFKKFI